MTSTFTSIGEDSVLLNGQGGVALDPEAAAELAFYHDYIDHYRIAEHYFQGNLLPDERSDFQAHLLGCQECADRVLLAEFFEHESAELTRAAKPKASQAFTHSPFPPATTVVGTTVIGTKLRQPREPEAVSQPQSPTNRLPPVPTDADAAALQSLLASISMPLGQKVSPLRGSASRNVTARNIAAARVPQPEAVPAAASENPATETKTKPVELPVLNPSTTQASPAGSARKVCAYLVESRARGRGESGVPLLCTLPLRARWVASLSPVELVLIFAAAVLLLIAIPSAMFLWELSRIAAR